MSGRLARGIARLKASSPAWRFRLAAVVAAATGGAATLAVHFDPGPAPPITSFSLTRAQELQLERIGGRFAVEAAKFQTWFDGLWVGPARERTYLVLTIAAVAACLWLAHLVGEGGSGEGGADADR